MCLCFEGFKLYKWTRNNLENHLWICPWLNALTLKNITKGVPWIGSGTTLKMFAIFILWWFCYKSTLPFMMNPKPLCKYLWKWWNFNFHVILDSSRCTIWSLITFQLQSKVHNSHHVPPSRSHIVMNPCWNTI